MVWYYLIYYVSLVIVFVCLRRFFQAQDAQPKSNSKRGFGPRVSLGHVAREFFQHGAPRLLAVSIVGFTVARGWIAEWTWWDAIVAAGLVVVWPFQEWFVHSYILHLKPISIAGKRFESLASSTHRAHHRNPWEPKYGLTPIFFIVGFVGMIPMLWSFAYQANLLPLGACLTATVVTLSLILNYEWIHYLIHTSYVPRSRLYRRLWRSHRLHHFHNENYWLGVTMLAGDRLLGTSLQPDQATHSDECLNLGVTGTEESELVSFSPLPTPNQHKVRTSGDSTPLEERKQAS